MSCAKRTPPRQLLQQVFVYKDGKLFWKESKSGVKANTEAGLVSEKGYRRIKIFGKTHMAHRLVWAYHHDDVPDWLDHADENKLNNRLENLRPATKIQNGYNISNRKNNKSGVKGVYFCKKSKKWIAELSVNKQIKRVGYFDDIELAELVVCEARSLYHGQFASAGRPS